MKSSSSSSYDQCLENIKATVTLLNTLGLVTHPDKSVLEPTQQITFLGFQLNSLTMTISLTPEKAFKVKGPDVDLFASRLNNNNRKYISYRSDPGAQAVNAFTIPWGNLQFYAFPPFSIILKVLRKVNSEIATGLIVVPHWPIQSWWPFLTDMLIAKPIILPRKPDLLYLPSEPQRIHPLSKTMRLLLSKVSGDYSRVRDFRTQLQVLSCNPGEMVPGNSTLRICDSGNSTVVSGRLIPFQQL